MEEQDFMAKKSKIRLIIVMIVAIAAIAAAALVSYFYAHRRYDGYQVNYNIERSDSNNVSYCYTEAGILKYSRSGINAIDNTGKSLWNGGFEMKQPQIDTCGNYVVVADVTGKQFYVYNGEDEGVSIETNLPIVRAKVSAEGIVAVLVQDSDSNVLNLYNPYRSTGSLLVEIPTNIREEGYPLDFDISPNSTSLAVSYMITNGNSMENKVSFYNFTDVGQDQNSVVGGQSFGDSMIGEIQFLNNDEVAVFHENGVTLFRGMKQPEVLAEVIKENIQGAACSSEHIAIVTGESDQKILHLYDERGKEEETQEIPHEFTDIKIYKDEIFFLTKHSCYILRTNGQEKFYHEFEDSVEEFFPTTQNNVYLLINETAMQKITLKAE